MLAVAAVKPAASMKTSQSRAAMTLAIPASIGEGTAIIGVSPSVAESDARVASTSPAHTMTSDSASSENASRTFASAVRAASHAVLAGAGHSHATRSAWPAVRRGHTSETGGGGSDPHNALYAIAS